MSIKKILLAAIMLSMIESACYSQSPENNQADSNQLSVQTSSGISTAYLPTPCNTCLRLIKDSGGRKNSLGNPIYKLEAYLNGKQYYSFDAVTGRAFTQNRNRHQSGTEAPLPNGSYSVSSKIIPGSIYEAGETFLPVSPHFQTGRSALGIHYDPSFNKNNGEDGTSGCIGLTSKENRDLINRFASQYHPQLLIVEI
jgi:L,D-transpeptidase catalytic domain